MCIGMPMQVQRLEPGHAICQGRGEQRRVNTALVDQLQVGEWLLVFLNDARECISAQRAHEVNAALDMVQHAMAGDYDTTAQDDALGFHLPSHMNLQDLHALTGDKQ